MTHDKPPHSLPFQSSVYGVWFCFPSTEKKKTNFLVRCACDVILNFKVDLWPMYVSYILV